MRPLLPFATLLLAVLVLGAEESSPAEQEAVSQIAFVSDRDGNSEIYVINSDGSGLANLTKNPAWDHSPAWSPDGSKIAFRSRRGEGFYNLYVMGADGSNPTRLVTNAGDDGSGDYTPHWSPDGSKILFHANREGVSRSSYVVNLDGSDLTNLTLEYGLPVSQASWSPDGSKIVFESGRHIYVMKADGSNPTELAEGVRPAWHPDGSKIAFGTIAFGTMGLSSGIFSINPDGSDRTRLTDESGRVLRVLPSWSPDGTKIAFTKGGDELGPDGNIVDSYSEPVVMNADGSNQVMLTGQLLFDLQQQFPISWSPDGTRVVIARTDRPISDARFEDLNIDIYTVNIDGTGLIRLTDHPAMDADPVWSPRMN